MRNSVRNGSRLNVHAISMKHGLSQLPEKKEGRKEERTVNKMFRRTEKSQFKRPGRKSAAQRAGKEAFRNTADRRCELLFGRAFPVTVILVCVLLTACSFQRKDSGNSVQPSSKSEEFSAAVFYYDSSDIFIWELREDLTEDLVKAGITYSEYDAESDQSKQNTQIENAIDRGADLLIVNIVSSGSSDTSDAICLKADRRNIPVIFFNRAVEADGDEGVVLNFYENIAFVGTDPAEAGHMQGQMIGEYLISNYSKVDLNRDGVISYALFKGEAKNVEAIYRTKYSVEDANKILTKAGYPELQYFNEYSVDNFQLDLTGKWSFSAARDYMMTNLSQYNLANKNMIELIICNNDNMAAGAISALQEVDLNLGKTSNSITIPVFGVDATDVGKNLIADGCMTGTIIQSTEEMANCICLLARNVAQGEDIFAGTEEYARDTQNGLERKIYLPYEIYDPAAEEKEEKK